eukprot:jgi/Orpsp1_1/1174917/evm.model.c7180000051957.1
MKFQNKIKFIFSTIFLLNLVYAKDKVENEKTEEELILTPGPITGIYNENDLNEDYDKSSIIIHCDESTCKASCKKQVLFKKGEVIFSETDPCKKNISFEKGKVTISEAGTYILEGLLNGQLTVNANKEDLIHLILRNATISSGFGPAILSEKCKKLV